MYGLSCACAGRANTAKTTAKRRSRLSRRGVRPLAAVRRTVVLRFGDDVLTDTKFTTQLFYWRLGGQSERLSHAEGHCLAGATYNLTCEGGMEWRDAQTRWT